MVTEEASVLWLTITRRENLTVPPGATTKVEDVNGSPLVKVNVEVFITTPLIVPITSKFPLMLLSSLITILTPPLSGSLGPSTSLTILPMTPPTPMRGSSKICWNVLVAASSSMPQNDSVNRLNVVVTPLGALG